MSSDVGEKARAVFLAALMVMSVFAMGASFAGSAAAVDGSSAGANDSGDVQGNAVSDGTDATIPEEQSTNNVKFRATFTGQDGTGDTDTVTLQFPDEFAGKLSPNSEKAEFAVDDSSISDSSSIQVVDGDADGNMDAVEVQYAPSSDGDVEVQFDITIDAPSVSANTDFTPTFTYSDNAGDTSDTQDVTLTVADDGDGTKTLQVDDDFSNPEQDENTDGDNEYNTIQAAVDDASADDTIEVAAGSYSPVSTNTEVNLVATGDAVIDAGGSTGITVQASATDTLIDGFTIENGDSDIAGVYVAADDVTVQNNVLQENGLSGVTIGSGTDGVTVKNNQILNNGDGSGNNGVAEDNGIAVLDGATSVTIEDNEISGSDGASGDAVAGNGILFEGTSGITATVQDNTFSDNDVDFRIESQDSAGSVNGESTLNAQIVSVVNNNDLTTTNPYGVEVTPTDVTVGTTETVEATILGTGADQRSVEFDVDSPDPDANNPIQEGTSGDSSFSALVEFGAVGDYDVILTSETGSPTATITSTYTVENRSLDPSDPVYDDDLTVTGTLADGDGNAPATEQNVELVDPDGDTVASTTTTSSGDFLISDTLSDAGTYELTDGEGTAYDEIEVGAQQATLNLSTTDGEDPFFGESDTFQVDVTDAAGDPVEVGSASAQGYINVTGPFDEDPTALDDQTNITDAFGNGEGETAYIYVDTDSADGTGVAEFDATPLGESVNVSLEVDDGEDVYAGLEDDTVDTPSAPDYVADDDSLTVGQLDQLNFVSVSTDPVSVNEGSQDFTVTISGADGNGPSGDALYNATLEITGPNVDTSLEYANGEDDQETASITPNQAGNLTLTLTGYNQTDAGEAGEELGPVTKTVEVTGDQFADLIPAEDVSVDDTTDVGVTITDTAGDPINVDRNVIFETAEGASAFNATDAETGYSHLIISSDTNRVLLDDDRDISDNDEYEVSTFTTTTGEYFAENITFDTTATVDLIVEDPTAVNGGSDRVYEQGAFDIKGIDVYDIEVDVPNNQFLTGSEEQVNVSVYEDGERLNGSALEAISLDDADFSQAGASIVETSFTTADTNDSLSGVDVLQGTVNADESATADVNVTVTSDSGDRSGDASFAVVEPQISTTLGADNASTSTVYSPVQGAVQPELTENAESCESETPPACVYSYTRIHTVSAP